MEEAGRGRKCNGRFDPGLYVLLIKVECWRYSVCHLDEANLATLICWGYYQIYSLFEWCQQATPPPPCFLHCVWCQQATPPPPCFLHCVVLTGYIAITMFSTLCVVSTGYTTTMFSTLYVVLAGYTAITMFSSLCVVSTGYTTTSTMFSSLCVVLTGYTTTMFSTLCVVSTGYTTTMFSTLCVVSTGYTTTMFSTLCVVSTGYTTTMFSTVCVVLTSYTTTTMLSTWVCVCAQWNGASLVDLQLTMDNVPVIVDKCLEEVYRRGEEGRCFPHTLGTLLHLMRLRYQYVNVFVGSVLSISTLKTLMQ